MPKNFPGMNTQKIQNPNSRPDYGIDAPGVRLGMLAAGVAGLIMAVVSGLVGAYTAQFPSPVIAACLTLGVLVAMYGFFMGGYMTWASRVGKLQTRQRLLDDAAHMLNWTGREKVLDVGCGRGLMLVGAALRLTQGVAIGIDLWRAEDQANNTPEAALDNALLAGVADRISVDTGDARDLPYPDESFDLVVSHWVVHNIADPKDRLQVLDEMLRVLRPGGVIALADIEHVQEYRDHVLKNGAVDVKVLDGGAAAAVMGVLSGGSFRPQALLARKEWAM